MHTGTGSVSTGGTYVQNGHSHMTGRVGTRLVHSRSGTMSVFASPVVVGTEIRRIDSVRTYPYLIANQVVSATSSFHPGNRIIAQLTCLFYYEIRVDEAL